MFKYFIFTTLYLHILYLHQEQVLSAEAAMFFKVAQTGQTKPFEFLWQLKLPQVLFHVWKAGGGGGWGCVQLQHDTSPTDVTKFYTLNL